MSDVENKVNYLKKLYKEIVLGFSVSEYSGKPIFIKHFSEIDNGEQESYRAKYEELARDKGLQTREDKMQLLLKEGYWSRDKEIEIEKIKKEISDLELVRRNLIIKRQILQNKQKTSEANSALNTILKEKEEIFGFCLEDFVAKKVNEYTIFNSFFEDKTMQNKLLSEEEFDVLTENELSKLVNCLNSFYINFSHSQIKRICACPFFPSLYNLSGDNAYYFYGKHVVDLTILQVNMFSQGKYFKALVESRGQQGLPPNDVMEDPDKMIEWFEAESEVPKFSADGVSYVGATKEELRKMAGNNNAISVLDYAAKKGNSMTTKDFIEMHGI